MPVIGLVFWAGICCDTAYLIICCIICPSQKLWGNSDVCGIADNLKVTSAIAVVTTHLAWAMLESPEAFSKAEAMDQAMSELKWAADYLIACQTGASEYVALVRVGLFMQS